MAANNPVGHGEDDSLFAEINITPLTDIFLVLLIIFMVTTSTLAMQGNEVNLPQSATASDQPSGVMITFTKEGDVLVDDEKVAFENLRGKVQKALEGTSDKIAILRADQAVQLGDVVRVMSEAQKSGAAKLAIMTQPEEKRK